jgi:hypothetical protein
MYMNVVITAVVTIITQAQTLLFLIQPNKQTLIIARRKVKVQARVHQRSAAVRTIEKIARVLRLSF